MKKTAFIGLLFVVYTALIGLLFVIVGVFAYGAEHTLIVPSQPAKVLAVVEASLSANSKTLVAGSHHETLTIKQESLVPVRS